MNAIEALRDIVENKKTAILRSDGVILLFKNGLLMEATGEGNSREEVVKKFIEANPSNVMVIDVDPSAIISLQEPMDISSLIPREKARKISIDPILDSKIDAAMMMITDTKAIVAAQKEGDILSIKLADEEKAMELANKAEEVIDLISSMNGGNVKDIITILDNGTIYVKILDDDRYVVVLTGDNSNIGIIRAALATL